MKYPGDTAEPHEVAAWMAQVAKEEYGLPGILPVMTSCVELTSAWTGPGDVKEVPGYLYAADYDSLGYFQQRPSMGWGTPEQLIDADYALRAFLRAAKSIEDDSPADTPEQLGAWCQAVQRSAYPERYAEIGYPMAKELLEGSEAATDWPKRNIGFDKDGWALDLETNAWIKSDRLDTTLYTNAGGWLWGKPVKEEKKHTKQWEWPIANDEPTSGGYEARHPTRYFWRPDVEKWARYLVDNYDVWCNTYLEHPEGWGYDVTSTDESGTWYVQNTSIDVWGPAGRDDPIEYAAGQEIFNLLFNDPNPPNINWIIWQRTIYPASNTWRPQPFGDGTPFTNHEDHIHCTFI